MSQISYELDLSPDLPPAIVGVARERGESQDEHERLKVIEEFRNYLKGEADFFSIFP